MVKEMFLDPEAYGIEDNHGYHYEIIHNNNYDVSKVFYHLLPGISKMRS